ncbi:MAG: hypothetical protein NT040_10545 [Bacteroidetes bacterium]|nr:hypothetical protein [Bacteroidota bacterium]
MKISRFDGTQIVLDDYGSWNDLHISQIRPVTEIISFDLHVIYLDYINKALLDEVINLRAFPKDFEDYSPLPILFIGFEDLFSQNSDSFRESNFFKKLNIPLYYRFLDDSIWNNYLYLFDPYFKDKLLYTLNRIDSFHKLKLYSLNVTREYIEYNSRLCKESKLVNLKGHGTHIAPYLFHSESHLHSKIKISKDISSLFPDSKNESAAKSKGISLRILLIDDKIGGDDFCKAALVKKMLEFDWITDYHERFNHRENVCWRTPETNKDIKSEITETDVIIITSYIKCIKIDNVEHNFRIYKPRCHPHDYNLTELCKYIKANSSEKIQIIAIKNLDEARELLSHEEIRFDLILMDYLLDEISENKVFRREYATEFWGDGRENYFNISRSEIKKIKDSKDYPDADIANYEKKLEIYNKIKANRGPLQRLWIFPITAFNQTFIDDLRNKGIRLIDYYWYLSRGADPLNTPYLFIYTLNKFLQLQVENSIFSLDDLLGFLKKSIKKIKDLNDAFPTEYNLNTKSKLKNLFGSEYIFFITNYACEEQIGRDKAQGSLFANYIDENFYHRADENKDIANLLNLNKALRRIYYLLAYGEDYEITQCIENWYRLRDILAIIMHYIKQHTSGDHQTFSMISLTDISEVYKSITYRFWNGEHLGNQD